MICFGKYDYLCFNMFSIRLKHSELPITKGAVFTYKYR